MIAKEREFSYLPDRISRLGELAFNLWWSWHPDARELFQMLSGNGAEFRAMNPMKLLNEIDSSVLDYYSRDPKFLRRYDAIMARFDAGVNRNGNWFASRVEDCIACPITYFSAEYGLHHSLPFYAGGLGFLAGDFLKECSDLGVPLMGIGFMYPEGYLRQKISSNGWQINESEALDRNQAPICRVLDADNEPLVIRVPIIELPIYFEVWKAQVGRVPLFLIDTDIERNDPKDREISARLYIGDSEQRLIQEIVLGIGGAQIIQFLGIKQSILHLNEGHSAFAILEKIRLNVEEGLSFWKAAERVKATTIFTTHTPVLAGHDVFPNSLMDKLFGSYIPSMGIDMKSFLELGKDSTNPEAGFNMTAFAFRMSAYINAVSRKHGDVTKKIWHHLWNGQPEKIEYITNGIHIPTWIDPRIADLFNRYLGSDWPEHHDSPSLWELVEDIPDFELWMIHRLLKMSLIAVMQERARLRWVEDKADPSIILASGVMFDPSALTIGFARRFASYKRATLILSDQDRLKRILNHPHKPVQFVFAGKAHPSDDLGKQIIQKIIYTAKDPSFGGRLAFVEDYDEDIARYLVHGVDLWLNNPIPPFEASGTSGMKASLNGVPHLSVLDGWWLEGYNGRNGWALESDQSSDSEFQESQKIYNILEKEIVPLYYDRDESGIPRNWIKVMKEAIKSTAPHFNSRRMVKEYVQKFYQDAMMKANRIDI